MNRATTNIIRTIMDEFVPPVIRDSRWFMYPFFWYWFKGKNISLYMDFKKKVNSLSNEEFEKCYADLDCRAGDRHTDLNDRCIKYMLEKNRQSNLSYLDVGCGRGYWLNLLKKQGHTDLTGCDVFSKIDLQGIKYVKGSILNLPFENKSFDVVTCHHVLEHITEIGKAMFELKRVARKKVIIVVPRQRYFYYTLDLHLHFFWIKEELERVMTIKNADCTLLDGDWCFIGYLEN